MLSRIKTFWRAAPFATVLLAVALFASTAFGIRTAVFLFDPPARFERHAPVAAWMTPRYVSRSWGLPPGTLWDALELPRDLPRGPIRLAEIAEEKGVSEAEIIALVESVIAAHLESRND